jgi:hypothetical protein
LSAALVAWLGLAAWSSAQVESEENLNLLVSNDLLVPPGSYHGDDIVFRNRIGGMCFTASADYMLLSRVNHHSFTLLSNGQGGAEVLNANDLNFEMRTGPKLNLIVHQILFGCDVELGYMFVDGFSLSKSAYSGNTPLFFDGPLSTAQASNGAGINFDYISRIHSAESNLRYSGGGLFSILAGFRYIDLHEQLTASIENSGLTPFLTSNTDNHLYGGQIGAEMGMPIGKFHIAGIAKAGMFSNQADLTLYGTDANSAVGGVKGQLAFLGEVDVIGSYCITDNIAVRLGYQAMWLSGVATASDQLDLANAPSSPAWHPNTQSSLFYHGAFLGVEISF